MSAHTVRWGILGTGAIARQFALGLQDAQHAQLVAVGSRSAHRAAAFAADFNAPRRHESYEGLAEDSSVDVVYVATPHPMHSDNCLLLIAHGKAVLCEKPFTLNAAQAGQVIAAARSQGTFLMEAMWTRFIPAVVKAMALVSDGVIGDIRMVQADFGFRAPPDPMSRLLNKDLGGGSLLDVGMYPLSLTSMLLGAQPEQVVASAHLGETGVDEQAVVVLRYPGGELAVCSSAVRTNTPIEATIMGTEGSIRLHAPFYRSPGLTLRRGEHKEYFSLPLRGNGYNYEAEEVGRCLQQGLLESPIMPLDESLALMALMDTVRAQWQLRYPDE
mgnify:CR=1 FL=1